MFKRALIVMETHLEPEAVVQLGTALAGGRSGEVVFYTGLNATRLPTGDVTGRDLAAHWDSMDDLREQTEERHQRARSQAEFLGLAARSVIAAQHHSVGGVLSMAQAHGCDAIVVASEGRNAVVRLLSGSPIPGLITSSPVALAICPAGPRSDIFLERSRFRRILVLLDDGDLTGVALRHGLGLAGRQGAELRFVHIISPAMAPVLDLAGVLGAAEVPRADDLEMQSRQRLASASRCAEESGLKSQGTSLPAGTRAKDLAALAVGQRCDLLVIAHHGGNALTRLLTGSMIPGLITMACAPVLVCRPRGGVTATL